jgi:hypothetical protein
MLGEEISSPDERSDIGMVAMLARISLRSIQATLANYELLLGDDMPNVHVVERLSGITNILMGVHQASGQMTAMTSGEERQAFIESFLANVLPPIYRFGRGDCTDGVGRRSGQLDVVVEYPFSPSLPSVGNSPTRLYLAESVAAVVEVKSNVAAQWSQAQHTSRQLSPLRRSFGATMQMGGFAPTEQIPLFVAGYTGWTTMDTVETHLTQNPDVAGILVINSGLFASSAQFGGFRATGPLALWGLIVALHFITNGLQAASTNPLTYAT